MDKRFKKAEDEYFRLKSQLAGGRITQAEFEAALKELTLQDSQGRYWNLGPDSGKWYMYVGENWVEADPATASSPMEERAKMPPPRTTAPAPAPVAPAAAKSGGMGVIAIGLIVVVLLVVVVGGLLFASSQGVLQIVLGPSATPTMTPSATLTSTPMSTPSATPTTTSSPTSTPTVTPTRSPTPIPTAEPITKGGILLQDSLTGRNQSNPWSESTRTEDFYFQEGKYHVYLLTGAASVSQGSQLFSYPRQRPSFQDFILEADVTPLEGADIAAIGVTFRQTQEALYAFEISFDGRYRVRKNTNISTDLIKWTAHPAILGGKQTNALRVVAKGSVFTFYVNGAKVGSVTDSTFTSGTAGVEVSNLDTGGVVHGAFANLNIWSLGASPSAGTGSPTAEEFVKGAILFQDKLAANKEGWTETSKEGWNQGKVFFNWFYQDGKYHVSVLKPEFRAWGVPSRNPVLKDFVLEVTMTSLEGTENDTYAGVRFRDTNREFYFFQVNGSGSYQVGKFTKGVNTTLIPRTAHPAIQKGTPNKVMIVAKGASFSFFINDTKVGALSDSELLQGGIGLGTGSDILGLSHSSFQNITVWELK